jgi:hypothetical protein
MHLLFPLAFLSGVHGFLIFVPYLLAIVTIGHISSRLRRATKSSNRHQHSRIVMDDGHPALVLVRA